MRRLLVATGIFTPDIGGPASYLKALAGTLSERAVITVVTYSPSAAWPGDRDLPFRVVRVSRRIPKVLRHAVYFLRLLLLARGTDTVLALNAVSAGVPAMWAARFWKKRLVVRVPGDAAWEAAVNERRTGLLIDDFQEAPKAGRIGRLARWQSAVCRRADTVIALSEYFARVVEGWGVPRERIAVINNGVAFVPAGVPKEEARRQLGVAGIVLLSVGRMVPWKGFRMLIKLMPRLLQLNQSIRLVIVGDGPERKTLEGMIRTLGLERKVSLAGAKTAREVALYLAAADIFVLNTGFESFAHQILEAMAAGIPIVTTTAGSNREALEQGKTGIMVRFNDEFALEEAIKALLASPELRTQLADAARDSVRRFTVERMCRETEAVLFPE